MFRRDGSPYRESGEAGEGGGNMSGRIAAAAVLVAMVAAIMVVPVPAMCGDKSESRTIVITSDDESGGWLGVGISELDEKIREKMGIADDVKGVLVTEVYEDSPAEAAGIKANDVILSLDGEKSNDVTALVKLVKERKPGTDVTVKVMRDDKEHTYTATLAEREKMIVWDQLYGLEALKGLEALEGLEALKIAIPEISIGVSGWGGKGRLGVYVKDVSGDLADYFEVPGKEGVLVEGIVEGSAAEKAGIQAGDIIYKIDGEELCCTDELVKAIAKMETGVETPIELIRKGDHKTVMAVVSESEYDKAMHEYKIQLEKLSESDALIKVIEDEANLTDEERQELVEDLRELQEELKELREELNEMKSDLD